jgi:hypothetical protein
MYALDRDYAHDFQIGFFETFGLAVVDALPPYLRPRAERQLSYAAGDASALLIVLAHAGRAYGSMPPVLPAETRRKRFEEAVAAAALAVGEAFAGPYCRYVPPGPIANDVDLSRARS